MSREPIRLREFCHRRARFMLNRRTGAEAGDLWRKLREVERRVLIYHVDRASQKTSFSSSPLEIPVVHGIHRPSSSIS